MQELIRAVWAAPQRLGYVRYVPAWLNGYDISKPAYNGEYRFLKDYIKPGMTIFDVGANVGEYSRYVLSLNRSIAAIHCFEPVKDTYIELTNNLQAKWPTETQIVMNNLGLSNEPGSMYINVYDQHSEWNSLYDDHAGNTAGAKVTKQKVTLTTVDKYVGDHKVAAVDLLKLDVEGAELAVLEGARESLRSGTIRCIQFEYNNTFRRSSTTLKAVFELLSSYEYSVYRLMPWGKTRIDMVSPKLENYRYSNWVCLHER